MSAAGGATGAGRLTLLMCAAEALGMTGFAAYPSFLPLLSDLWHLTGAEAGLIGGAFFFGYMVAVPFLSGATDRIDARVIYIASCLLMTSGTLGFALPAGIGAKFGAGDRPVAVMTGDYGLQYTLNELGTAVEHKLPIVILMWKNDDLGQIRDDMLNKGIQPNAVTLKTPDFQLLARAYGLNAEKLQDAKALAEAIRKALAADGPTLIEMTPRMVHG